MKIPLTKGYSTVIDDNDYEIVKNHNWIVFSPKNHFYAATTIKTLNGKYKLILMHRLLLNFPKGKQIDHIDGDGLNNCRNNLRECTFSQNIRNSTKQTTYGNKPTTSKYKGVNYDYKSKKWVAHIYQHPKLIHLGRFDCEIEAALAYNEAAKKIFNSFARLNKFHRDIKRCHEDTSEW